MALAAPNVTTRLHMALTTVAKVAVVAVATVPTDCGPRVSDGRIQILVRCFVRGRRIKCNKELMRTVEPRPNKQPPPSSGPGDKLKDSPAKGQNYNDNPAPERNEECALDIEKILHKGLLN